MAPERRTARRALIAAMTARLAHWLTATMATRRTPGPVALPPASHLRYIQGHEDLHFAASPRRASTPQSGPARPVRRPPRAASSMPSGSCGWTEEFLSVQDPRLELPSCRSVKGASRQVPNMDLLGLAKWRAAKEPHDYAEYSKSERGAETPACPRERVTRQQAAARSTPHNRGLGIMHVMPSSA